MSDEVTTGAAGAPAEAVAGFMGGFAPGQPPIAMDAPVEAPPAEAARPAEAPVAEKPVSLAELIRARREEREKRVAAEKAAEDKAKTLEELRTKVTQLEGLDMEADPIGYARAHNWTKETQLRIGQAMLYDLMPDKAPEDFHRKQLEAKLARKEQVDREARQREQTEREAAQTKAQQEAAVKQITDYAVSLGQAAKNFDAGTYPESEAWFGDDHETYTRSLLATANNLAQAASAQGRVADLSPATVAAVLETEMAARQKRRDQRKQSAAGTAQAVTQTASVKTSTTSTRGLTAGGPRQPAKTEAERLERAVAAAFGTR